MALTDTTIRNTKPQSKPFKVSDGSGLYLLVSPSGGKWWRLKYRLNGKEQLLSLGTYPDIGLKAAREQRDAIRTKVALGIDPSAHRRNAKAAAVEGAANSFELITREWFEVQRKNLTSDYVERMTRRFDRDIFPVLGRLPIAEIRPALLLKVLRKMEGRGVHESAHRALGECGRIFRYAVATQRVEIDVTASLRGALQPTKTKHLTAITEPKEVGTLLRAIWGYSGSPVVCAALKLAPMVFVRPSELRHAEWEHINLTTGEWRYLVTKTQTEHIVPLSKQAREVLKELQLLTGRGRYVFPSMRAEGRAMSDNAILAALRRMGIPSEEMTGHGFRAMARTILDEVLGFQVDWIEHQLAHAVRDANGRAYNRTSHIVGRTKMMQAWSDYLDSLRVGAEIVPIGRRG